MHAHSASSEAADDAEWGFVFVRRRSVPALCRRRRASGLSDADWGRDATAHFTKYETQTEVTPDHVDFAQWDDHPVHALPEMSPAAMTYDVDGYFRPRTHISLNAEQSWASGEWRNRGTHTPIGAAEVTISRLPSSGPGDIATYTITGTVPAVAETQALLQICVNFRRRLST